MALAPYEQFIEAVKRSRSVAVVLTSAGSADAVGSAIALAEFIGSYGKAVEIVCPDYAETRRLAFLPKLQRIQPALKAARRLILTMPFAGELHDLRHEIADGKLTLTVTPSLGNLDPNAIAATASEWKHDLIVAVGVPDAAELLAFGHEHREFFENIPIVNIDTRPENENYGAINILDLRAGATAELVANLFEAIDPKKISPDIATCLYAGIVSETRNFMTPGVTPKTLEIAGRLVFCGARREEIVEKLFRDRPIEALRLWGRVLARLKADREHKIVWSMLGRADFMHAGADETHLADVIDELISRTPDAEVICLLHEHPQTDGVVCGLISAERGWNAMHLAAKWNPTGTMKRAKIQASGVSLPAFETDLIGGIRSAVVAARRR